MRNSRTLVLCFDGTADQYDAENTNVVRLFSLLQKGNNSSQLVYYQYVCLALCRTSVYSVSTRPGVGTYLEPGVVSPLFTWGAKVLDEAVAWYLPQHVIGGYTYLMSNYSVGDKICLFGPFNALLLHHGFRSRIYHHATQVSPEAPTQPELSLVCSVLYVQYILCLFHRRTHGWTGRSPA